MRIVDIVNQRIEQPIEPAVLYPWRITDFDDTPGNMDLQAESLTQDLHIITRDQAVVQSALMFFKATKLEERAVAGDFIVNALDDILEKAMRKEGGTASEINRVRSLNKQLADRNALIASDNESLKKSLQALMDA